MQTRVGYAGGTTNNPTYRQMGDHSECVEIVFDPKIISLEKIVHHFWTIHKPNRSNYKGRQYLSIILCEDSSQLQLVKKIKNELEVKLGEPIQTEIASLNKFSLAEEKHQKYYLKRYSKALESLLDYYSSHDSFMNSTLVARLNGFVKGYCSLSDIKNEITSSTMAEEKKAKLTSLINSLKW